MLGFAVSAVSVWRLVPLHLSSLLRLSIRDTTRDFRILPTHIAINSNLHLQYDYLTAVLTHSSSASAYVNWGPSGSAARKRLPPFHYYSAAWTWP